MWQYLFRSSRDWHQVSEGGILLNNVSYVYMEQWMFEMLNSWLIGFIALSFQCQ